ncbi:MAG TPA: AMP-binding protein [Pseudomonadales bacterium]|nr:AMP-binding protein [Pseudomonadales bacterium]
MNLYQRMLDAAIAAGDGDAFRLADGSAVGHQALHARVGVLAAHLQRLGVEAGDRVAVQVEKSLDNVVLYLATLRCGGVYLPLNSAYTGAEIAYFIDDAQPRLLVCDPAAEAALAGIAASHAGMALRTLDGEGCGSLFETLDPASTEAAVVERADEDLAAILYTSGTTGRSKGAMLSHGNLHANAATLRALWGWRRDDVLLHTLPIYHVHGLFVALHCALLEPSPVLLLPRFDAAEVVRRLPEATVYMGVPTHYVRLLDEAAFDADACASMRLFVSGSAPLLPETFAAFEARTGQRILERYGMTEAGMITSNPLLGPRVAGTVGPPLPDVEVRVVREDGSLAEVDEVGSLEIRGPNVFGGYWRNPDKTAESFRDGWFVTGDLVTRDADGRVSIVGRDKDLVISGGLNVYPREVEFELDALAGVRESAVIGAPHRDFGEAVVAVVVREPGDAAAGDEAVLEARLIEALRARLAAFKVPKRICFIDALPRNAMGKVQKNQLRDAFADLFVAGRPASEHSAYDVNALESGA